MPRITPFLWFDNNAEEAMNFYVSIFKNSKVVGVQHFGEGGPAAKGSVMGCEFQLEGQVFRALNGGPKYRFTPAISIYVDCETQAEVDQLWAKLSASPADEQCGWLKDKFGLSWQIIPRGLGALLGHKDPKKAARAVQAMLKMKKIDIAALQKAAEG